MSSLAAARADNFYYNPEAFDPSKRGRDGPNAIAGVHALGDRARRLASDGILVVRFELPHDGWCAGCGQHVARGVRFNADKSADGAYHSTRVWRFEMKCTACPSRYVIKTDPANADYAYVSGIARSKVRSFDVVEDTGGMAGLTDAQRAALADGGGGGGGGAGGGGGGGNGGPAFYRLERDADDRRVAATAHRQLADLAELQAARYGDDYGSNRALRDAARATRDAGAVAAAEGAALGLALPLLPAAPSDAAGARLMMITAAAVTASGRKRRREGDARDDALMRAAAGESDRVLPGFVRGRVQSHGGSGSGSGAARIDVAAVVSGAVSSGLRRAAPSGLGAAAWAQGAGLGARAEGGRPRHIVPARVRASLLAQPWLPGSGGGTAMSADGQTAARAAALAAARAAVSAGGLRMRQVQQGGQASAPRAPAVRAVAQRF